MYNLNLLVKVYDKEDKFCEDEDMGTARTDPLDRVRHPKSSFQWKTTPFYLGIYSISDGYYEWTPNNAKEVLISTVHPTLVYEKLCIEDVLYVRGLSSPKVNEEPVHISSEQCTGLQYINLL